MAVAHSDDKRAITIMLTISHSGVILPYQLIYTGKTKRCLPDTSLLPPDFLLSYNPTHWSNEEETLKLLNLVIDPYLTTARSELQLPQDQKALLIWDDFRGHKTAAVQKRVAELNISLVGIPANFTHLCAPLDLTVNRSLKLFEQQSFTDYFSSVISTALAASPDQPIEDIEVDTKLSTLKPLHATTMRKSYEFFKGEGKRVIASGWRASGITAAIRDSRRSDVDSILDPFAGLVIS